MLQQIKLFLLVGCILPMVVSIIIGNKLGAILYHLLQVILPYIMFFKFFPKYGLKKGHSQKVVYFRIIVASIIWSLAIYLAKYAYKVLDPLYWWFVSRSIYAWEIEMFIYWSFSLVVAVLLSAVIATMFAPKDQEHRAP